MTESNWDHWCRPRPSGRAMTRTCDGTRRGDTKTVHRWLLATLGVLMLAAPAVAQTAHVAIVVGLAGDPEHAELFQRWAATMVDGATKMGVTKDHLIYLAEKPETDAQRSTGKSTKEEVVKA